MDKELGNMVAEELENHTRTTWTFERGLLISMFWANDGIAARYPNIEIRDDSLVVCEDGIVVPLAHPQCFEIAAAGVSECIKQERCPGEPSTLLCPAVLRFQRRTS
jgi:hypothetical protein